MKLKIKKEVVKETTLPQEVISAASDLEKAWQELEAFESTVVEVLAAHADLRARVDSCRNAVESAAVAHLPEESSVEVCGVSIERYVQKTRALDVAELLAANPNIVAIPGALKMNLDSFDKLCAAGNLPADATKYLSETTKPKVSVRKT